MDHYQSLLQKTNSGNAVVGVLGLGYVGLPLAVAFAKARIRTIGFDKDKSKTECVARGGNYISDVADSELSAVVSSGMLTATDDFSRIRSCDAAIICVPTPLDRFKKPDMSFIEAACHDIARAMKPGCLICLESTTYPTTTEHIVLPIIEKVSGLKLDEDFWLCYSPERVDPGNKQYKTENTPKVVGGLGERAQKLAVGLYGKAIKELHPVSSPRVAEMVKILENTYRLVNISLINELALLAGKMDINIWEVIEAAKTKPYGFQAFYPGPGIGGHCIPLDPFYLEYVAKEYNFDLSMIHTAGQINTLMPHRMMNKIAYALNRQGKPLSSSRVLFLGVAYKPDINDPRESPVLSVMDEVARKRAEVIYHDPYIPEVKTHEGRPYKSQDLTDELIRTADCVVFATNHSAFDVDRIASLSRLIVDFRNAIKTRVVETDRISKL